MSIAKRPNGHYRARYRGPDGKERSRTFKTKRAATEWLAGVSVARQVGEWVDPARGRMKVSDWAQQWLDAQVQLKPSTRARYEGVLRVQVLPTWGKVSLAQVGHADVAAWLSRLVASGLSPRTVHKAHRVLSLLLDLAVRDRRIAANPAKGVALPRAETAPKRYLTAGQVAELATAAGDDGTLIYVLAYCGLRFGEAAALQVGDVDLMRRRLHVERSVADVNGHPVVGTPKTHQRREVPLPRFLLGQLTAQVAGRTPGDLVFTSPQGGMIRANNFRRRIFDPAVDAAGLDGLTPHELRHTAASLAVSAGGNVKAVQRMLGHASAAMTLDVYAGLFGDDLDALADRLDEAASRASADLMRTEHDRKGVVAALGRPV